MNMINLNKNFLLFTFTVLLVALFSGCAQDQSSLESPVDTVTVDRNLNDISKTNNANNSLDGSESSETHNNDINSMEKKLSVVNFKFDQFDVDSSMEDILSKNSAKLNSEEFTSKNIKLEGNCDEWGSDEYNYALGLKRAKAVKEFLVSEGVDKSRISIISFGESNPVCSEKSKSCWYKNRRVATKLLP